MNSHQGLLQAIGFLLVIPLAILSDQIIKKIRRERIRKNLRHSLIHEIWRNFSLVSQIEKTYELNMEGEGEGVKVGHRAPRTTIIEKFVEFENLQTLFDFNRTQLLEIYGELKSLEEEYFIWREWIFEFVPKGQLEEFKARSSIVLDIVPSLMTNMINFWVSLIDEHHDKANLVPIQKLGEEIRRYRNEGKTIFPCYKTSLVNLNNLDKKNDKIVVVCWEEDKELDCLNTLSIQEETIPAESVSVRLKQ